jgi:hypothetical protein
MSSAKLIVIYPVPTDMKTFERRYADEYISMAVEKLAGKTSFVASFFHSKVNQIAAPFHHIAEVYFPLSRELEACLNSSGCQETAGYAVDISSGSSPFLTA